MSYVPPHKRLSKTQEGPPPTPVQLVPEVKKSFNLHSSRSISDRRTDKNTSMRKKIIYAHNSISKWLAVPLMDDGQFPSSIHFVPVPIESIERKLGEKPFTFVNGREQQENHDVKSYHLESPLAPVAESIHSDLLSAFQNVRNELADQSLEETKIAVVARFGKVLFQRNPSLSLDSFKERSVSGSCMRDLRRMFYTNVPFSYVEHIKNGAVPKLGVHFEEEKELYHVKLADAARPDSTISCKCRVHKDEKKLELYKIELNPVRHLLVDISCLDRNVDLRLALCTKRILIALTDDEKQNIRDLISSAILDPNLKGGLRWPLGKANSGGRYSVVGVWHTKTEAYRNSVMRLKVREADRFDFLTSAGEVTREVILVLTGMTRALLGPSSESKVVFTMLQDGLKLIWDHFLAWDSSLVSCCES